MQQSNFNGNLLSDQQTDSFPYGLLQGVGLIETMLYRKGTVRFFEAHHKRLINGLQTLGLNSDLWTPSFMETELNKTSADISADSLHIRLQTGPDARGKLWWLLQAAPLAVTADPVHLIFAKNVLRFAQPLSALKSAERLCFYLAGQEAKAQDKADALLLNQYGRVVESTIANLFWIKEGRLYTPALPEGCVAGVFRQQLISRKVVTESQIGPEELLQAEELFLTNALRGIIPVRQLQGRSLPTEQTLTLQRACKDWV